MADQKQPPQIKSEEEKQLANKATTINTGELTLEINMRSRTKNFFQGKVKSITAHNKTGLFDILPMHANFITLIEKFIILDRGLPVEKRIDFDSAVMSVLGSKVDVYVGV